MDEDRFSFWEPTFAAKKSGDGRNSKYSSGANDPVATVPATCTKKTNNGSPRRRTSKYTHRFINATATNRSEKIWVVFDASNGGNAPQYPCDQNICTVNHACTANAAMSPSLKNKATIRPSSELMNDNAQRYSTRRSIRFLP